MARRATFIKQVRAENENTLVLDAGSALGGMAGLNAATNGAVAVAAMNLMGYNAMALGQRELVLGASVLRQRMAESDFAFLSANAYVVETGELIAQPYIVMDVGGHRVSIIGLTEPLASQPKPDGETETLAAKDPLQAGIPYIKEAMDQSDVVIVLSHMGQAADETLALQVPGIDAIIEGRDGMILTPARYNTTGPIMAQAGTQGQLVGIVQVTFDEQGNITGYDGRAQLLTSDYADDPEMALLLEGYRQSTP